MTMPPGTRLGPYEILSPLGSGGMGEVYRARDRKLDRDVAIKVLPPHLNASPAALARFEREAKAVAALSHPNILSIFDFGTQSGTAYAVTELLEGETLRSKLESGLPPRRQAIDYGLQIAKGLAAAHERGVVHRDLKPENIFVSKDGHLKILDFGLAKRDEKVAPDEVTSAPTASGETEPGTVMGTVGYMSPEQVRAIPADHRSDIFSFGTILYEMLSGKRAFRRGSGGETMAAILRDEPQPLGPDTAETLARVVQHCLEKDRDNRFQSARDVIFALSDSSTSTPSSPAALPPPAVVAPKKRRRGLVLGLATVVAIAGGTIVYLQSRARKERAQPSSQDAPAKRVRRIVVLPFENLGAPEDTYFATGMAEEIINRLASLQELSVISRATAMGYDRKGKTVKQIGVDLGVDFVLEGTVRWEKGGREGRVSITPELIQVSDDTQLWGERYDRVIADIFVIQSEVAENVVRAMGVKLVPRERTALAAASTTNMEAYDFYLRGLEQTGRGLALPDQEGALRMFQAAVDRDPGFSPALAQLAKAHLSLYFYFGRFKTPPDRSHVESAKKLLDRLAEIGPDLPDTLVARGYYTYWGLDELEPALVDFRRAVALQPSNIPGLSGVLFVLRRLGRWGEAGDQMLRLVALDPRDPEILRQCGQTSMVLRRYGEADRYFSLATTLSTQNGHAWGQRILLQLLWKGDTQKAEELVAAAHSVNGLVDDFGLIDFAAFRVSLARRDFREALQRLDVQKRETVNYQFFCLPVELERAELYTYLHDPESARRWFEAARRRLEELIAKAPKDSRYHSALGIAYAGLGLPIDALREARAGVELMPISADAWRAMWRIQDLARVLAMIGKQGEAIDRLAFLLSHNSELSVPVLRLDPRWDSLRVNPKFQELLANH